MLLLNFTHPLSPAQLVQLAELAGQPVDRTLGEMVHFDPQAPLHPQILAIVDRLALDTTTWQTAPIDDGRWTMDDGRWTMDDGRPTMDDGRPTMDDRRWTTDDGRRWTAMRQNDPMTKEQSPMTTYFPEHLQIGVYRITLVALEPVELSAFSAATLRGAFGWSFKRMVCYQPQVTRCDGCLLRGQCPYPRVFEPPPPPGTIYAEQERAVAPYVLRRPLAELVEANEPRRYGAGEAIVFEVVLMGWANGLLPYFALALQQLEASGVGRGRGRVMVAAIDLLPPPTLSQEGGTVGATPLRLFDARTPGVIENHGGWPAGQWLSSAPAPAQVTVHFVSPTRLQSEGRVQGEPAFHVFYRALLRRVSALCTVHTAQMWETDFAGLAEAARRVETRAASMKLTRQQRHSDRQGAMEFWGAEGLMVYAGELTPFWPLLQLGQVLHVGKNCTFGLGQYGLV